MLSPSPWHLSVGETQANAPDSQTRQHVPLNQYLRGCCQKIVSLWPAWATERIKASLCYSARPCLKEKSYKVNRWSILSNISTRSSRKTQGKDGWTCSWVTSPMDVLCLCIHVNSHVHMLNKQSVFWLIFFPARVPWLLFWKPSSLDPSSHFKLLAPIFLKGSISYSPLLPHICLLWSFKHNLPCGRQSTRNEF